MLGWNHDNGCSRPRFEEIERQIKEAIRTERQTIRKPGPVSSREIKATNRELAKSMGLKNMWKKGARVVIIRENATHPPVLPPSFSAVKAAENRKSFMDRDQSRIWTKDEIADIVYKLFGVRKPPVRKPQTLDQLIAKAADKLRRAS